MKRDSLRPCSSGIAALLLVLPPKAAAAVFDGGGIAAGFGAAGAIQGLTHRTIRDAVTLILVRVLDFLALVSVIVIVGAGVWMILGLGEESSRDGAKKIIVYTTIGLVIVFFSRLIVSFIRIVLSAGL